MKGFCQDFSIKVGKNDVTIHYLSDRVCWEGGNQRFCYDAGTIIEFRDFINDLVDSGATVTNIVDEFQIYFAVRRQRIFWIVESMLSRDWCVLEVVIAPDCIIDNGSASGSFEWHNCFEHIINVEDMRDYFISAMHQRDIRLLTNCGKGARYVPLHFRYVRLGDTDCPKAETDYRAWIDSVMNEAESIIRGD